MNRRTRAWSASLGGVVVLAACTAGPTSTDETAAASGAGHARTELVASGTERLATAPLRQGGLMAGEVPFRDRALPATPPLCAGANLVYYGGPVLQSPQIYAVFWTGQVNPTLQLNIGTFYGDITGPTSTYWSWLVEYDTVGKSPGSNQALLNGTFAGAVTITPSVCATQPPRGTCSLLDA